jgi:hypothetical protein
MARAMRKRSHHQEPRDGTVVCMDDLAVAMEYALATPQLEAAVDKSSRFAECQDQDEISIGSSSSSEKVNMGGRPQETIDIMDRHNIGQGDSSLGKNDEDDVESDVDLEEDLRRMTQDGIDEDEGHSGNVGTGGRPKTAHEIDPYQANASELKSEFGLDVTLEELELLQVLSPSHAQMHVAGHIQHHMVSERTMVIQSQQGGELLEEGSLLVFRVPSSEKGGENIVPLGRILEIFGPVSHPLYSIRLPELLPDKATESSAVAANSTNGPMLPEALCNNDTTGVKERDNSCAAVHDPWNEDGIYTLKLKETPSSRTVFYLHERAITLDRMAIFKRSGRGCDASNVFDEEITNPHDQDFSDDEEERMARRRSRPGKPAKPAVDAESAMRRAVQPPQGFHPGTAPPRQSMHMGSPYPSQPVYPHQPQYAQQHMYYTAPQQTPHSQHYPTLPATTHPPNRGYTGRPAHFGIPPPPPPPIQQEEESDTVYYDLG